MFHVKRTAKRRPGHIPSPRALKLARFERPDFRAPRRAKHREGDWIWQRAWYRIARRLRTAQQALSRALRQLVPTRTPSATRPLVTVRLSADTHTYRRQSKHAAAMVHRLVKQVGRRSSQARLSARHPGAHRLENLAELPSKAYMAALDVRYVYVTQKLLRLKGLATSRAFGETSWREARRADHYATA